MAVLKVTHGHEVRFHQPPLAGEFFCQVFAQLPGFMEQDIHICIFGAAPDTSNLGVSALLNATIAGLTSKLPGCRFTVFDNGFGVRRGEQWLAAGCSTSVELRGVRHGKRFIRPENQTNMGLAARLGPLAGLVNRNVRAVAQATVVLDLSGGDSFSDIYGTERFQSVIFSKLLAHRLNKRLILLPQTYGPYVDPRKRNAAAAAVQAADMCWARDARSFAILKQLLGPHLDPARHLQGVDVAFSLEPREAADHLPTELRDMLAADRSQSPLMGFNVSGLIYNQSREAEAHYGFKADYQELVVEFLKQQLESTPINLVLVPHVMSRSKGESDPLACQQVAVALPERFRQRVVIAPRTLDANQIKWLIGQTDWFCGTRMHSTIAALSSGVPTATINYSDKALGVFESCQQGHQVFDPRQLTTAECVTKLGASFADRVAIKAQLAAALPAVRQMADQQMTAIAERIQSPV